MVPLAAIEAFARLALQEEGASEPQAAAVARSLTACERDACHSHGLFRLPGYIKALRAGVADGHATPTVHWESRATLIVDGHSGLAPLAHELAQHIVVERIKQTGVAAVALRRVLHLSALWTEVEPYAERGLVALAFRNGRSCMAGFGLTQPIFGTNPMALAWPRPNRPSFVFDFATSAMSRGDIGLAARDGHAIPAGTALDAAGIPTTDATEALAGVQLPFGGAKGAMIAMLVELLSGPLIGEMLSCEADKLADGETAAVPGGELLLIFDPSGFGLTKDALGQAEQLFGTFEDAPEARLPGARRQRARKATLQHGVAIPDGLKADLFAHLGPKSRHALDQLS